MPSLTGQAVAARARALVGTRFRPQGRSAEHGLDCVGLVAAAADIPVEMIPSGYRLRSQLSETALSTHFGERVRTIDTGEAGEGDVLLVRAGMGQDHFLVLVEGGFVHADAGLGRVVERPGAVPWPMLAAWRIREAD